jgi:dinuclear metal center YbgI/SA1388 family protein
MNAKSTTKPKAKPKLKAVKSVDRDQLSDYLADLMQVNRVKDYCPNGLQVQGKNTIKKIVTGVTASLALIDAAIEEGADAILVHHGWFWKNDDVRVVGQLHARLKLLMENDISLFAYHLPLDLHRELGNNAQLAQVMGWIDAKASPAAFQGTMDGFVWQGNTNGSQRTLGQLARSVASRLGRDPLVIGDLNKPIKSIAWCTGAAQGYITEAIAMKVDAYISGEVSEQTFHASQEMGVAFIAAGHHATERYGIQALGQHLSKKWGVKHQFIDIPNPI